MSENHEIGEDGRRLRINSKKIIFISFFIIFLLSNFSLKMLFNQGATLDLSLPFLSRLVTRTKEYNMWARVKVKN